MSASSAIGSYLKRIRTPTRLFVKSGPGRSWSFSDMPLNLAEQSNTTPNLVSTEVQWCGKYHVRPRGAGLSAESRTTYPLSRFSFILAELTHQLGSDKNCFLRQERSFQPLGDYLADQIFVYYSYKVKQFDGDHSLWSLSLFHNYQCTLIFLWHASWLWLSQVLKVLCKYPYNVPKGSLN